MNQILRILNNYIFINNYYIVMKIKHSKYKNTGLIFELLVRKITSDTLSENEWELLNDNNSGWINSNYYSDPNRYYGP